MKIPRGAASALIAIEAVVMAVVLIICIIHPKPEIPQSGSNGVEITHQEDDIVQNTENAIGDGTKPSGAAGDFSEAVLAKVNEMTLEQKIAQMFIITPEALTETDKVTLTGNTTRNALSQYPVGGMVYSAINFQGKTQTINMLNGVKEHYKDQFGLPIFLMIAERGGAENSPLATVNAYNVEASPAEVGASGEPQTAIRTASDIAKYLEETGFNTNLAPNADLAAGVDTNYDNTTYSADAAVAAMMVAETVSTYEQKGLASVMSMFPGESMGNVMSKELAAWREADELVYKAGIDAGVDCMMVANAYAPAFTGDEVTPCCMSANVVRFLRGDLQYNGVLISDNLSEEHIATNYTSADAAVAAIRAGMDMVYCPANFKEAYQGVLDAVSAGKISEKDINTAVARILSCKENMD